MINVPRIRLFTPFCLVRGILVRGYAMSNEELVIRIQAGIDEAENMLLLWQQCQKFITMIAKKFSGRAEIEDLEQEGYFGLSEAVRKYDTNMHTPFVNYAALWIKQYMRRYIINCTDSVRMPVHAKEKLWKYKRVLSDFKREHGRKPADHEICFLMDISLEQLEQLRKNEDIDQVSSLDTVVPGAEGDITLGDTIASDQELESDVIHDLDSERLRAEMADIMDSLGERKASVIYSRYYAGKTLKETGAALGIGGEAARKIQVEAIRELRRPRYAKRLQPYVDDRLSVAAYRHVGVEKFNRTWTSATEYAAIF